APDPRPSEQALVYVTEQPAYGGTCRVCPDDTPVRVLTFAEVRDRKLTFTAQVSYPGRTHLVAQALAVQGLTPPAAGAAVAPRVVVASGVAARVRRGGLRTARVRLRNWEGEKVELDAPGAVTRPGRRRAPGDRTWTLELGPEVRGDYRVTLTGSVPVEH